MGSGHKGKEKVLAVQTFTKAGPLYRVWWVWSLQRDCIFTCLREILYSVVHISNYSDYKITC